MNGQKNAAAVKSATRELPKLCTIQGFSPIWRMCTARPLRSRSTKVRSLDDQLHSDCTQTPFGPHFGGQHVPLLASLNFGSLVSSVDALVCYKVAPDKRRDHRAKT